MPHKKRILLLYPKMGLSGSLVRHMPLSLIYAATDSLAAGFAVEIIDVRLCPDFWRREIAARMSPEVILVGLSVMTGAPILSALEMSRWLKKEYPQCNIVWGGPHAQFNAAEILSESSVDFAVCGYGSRPLARLAKYLRGDVDALQVAAIPGLVYRSSEKDAVQAVPPEAEFELIDFRALPYSLVEKNLRLYGQLDSNERIFSMYSTLGCPYQCAFCSSPAQYNHLPTKYLYLEPEVVVDHIEFVHTRYEATYIYFIDDDSFVSLQHVEAIIDEINRRGIQVKLGFRGARINEIMTMDDVYLDKLSAAGTNILHIGAESGSQHMLDLMKKNCTVDDILVVNRKLSRHPKIIAAYNWLLGLPGETLDDLRETRELILRLIRENPAAIIFAPNTYRPLPGTELYDTAVQCGYSNPENLHDWADIEVEGDYRPPWCTDESIQMINMMLIASYFIDYKLSKVNTGNTLKYLTVRVISWFYAPIAKLRYRFGFSAFLFEYQVYKFFAARFKQ